MLIWNLLIMRFAMSTIIFSFVDPTMMPSTHICTSMRVLLLDLLRRVGSKIALLNPESSRNLDSIDEFSRLQNQKIYIVES